MKMNKEQIKIGVWSAIGGAAATIVIGFAWGGWVLGGTSSDLGNDKAQQAIVERLTPICVAQFNKDPEKEVKFLTFKELKSWDKERFVKDQGWATMPFETEPDMRVADACSSQITKINL